MATCNLVSAILNSKFETLWDICFVYNRHLNIFQVVETIFADHKLDETDETNRRNLYVKQGLFISFLLETFVEKCLMNRPVVAENRSFVTGATIRLFDYLLSCDISDMHCLNLLLLARSSARSRIKFVDMVNCFDICTPNTLSELFRHVYLSKVGSGYSPNVSLLNSQTITSFGQLADSYGHKEYKKRIRLDYTLIAMGSRRQNDLQRDICSENITTAETHSSDYIQTIGTVMGMESFDFNPSTVFDESEFVNHKPPEVPVVVSLSEYEFYSWLRSAVASTSDVVSQWKFPQLLFRSDAQWEWKVLQLLYSQQRILRSCYDVHETDGTSLLSTGQYFTHNVSSKCQRTANYPRHTQWASCVAFEFDTFLSCVAPTDYESKTYAMIFSNIFTNRVKEIIESSEYIDTSLVCCVQHSTRTRIPIECCSSTTEYNETQLYYFVQNLVSMFKHLSILPPHGTTECNSMFQKGLDVNVCLPGSSAELKFVDFQLPYDRTFCGSTVLINPFQYDVHFTTYDTTGEKYLILKRFSILVVAGNCRYGLHSNFTTRAVIFFSFYLMTNQQMNSWRDNKKDIFTTRYDSSVNTQPMAIIRQRFDDKIVVQKHLISYQCARIGCSVRDYYHYPFCADCLSSELQLTRKFVDYSKEYGLFTQRGYRKDEVIFTENYTDGFFEIVPENEFTNRYQGLKQFAPYVSIHLENRFVDQITNRGISSVINTSVDNSNCKLEFITSKSSTTIVVQCTATKEICTSDEICTREVSICDSLAFYVAYK